MINEGFFCYKNRFYSGQSMYFLETIEAHKDEILAAKSYIEVYKPYSMTPLELVQSVVKKVGAKKGSFSGRLDPMACGLTRIFLDENCKGSKEDLACGKRYRFQIVLGISSSSLDMLGFPEYNPNSEIILYGLLSNIDRFLETISKGNYIQELPIYSSYPVVNREGLKKPLWWWAKEKRIDEITIPSAPKYLYHYGNISLIYRPLSEIIEQSIIRIKNINHSMDFNQTKIIECWKQLQNSIQLNTQLPIIQMTVDVSSGFYVRQLVADIGKYLDIPTTTLEIERLAYLKK